MAPYKRKTVICQFPGNSKKYHFYAPSTMAVVKGQYGYVKCRGHGPNKVVIEKVKVVDVFSTRTNKANMPFLGAIAQDLEHAYYCAYHVPANKSLVLNLHREPVRTVPVTEAQLKLIRKLEKETGFTFKGRWMIDACNFIEQCETHLQHRKDLVWSHLEIEATPNSFHMTFTLPEELGYPPRD